MGNIEITNKILTESENRQGQSEVMDTIHFVLIHLEFIKGQNFFNCMYQNPFELQNTKERASLVRRHTANGTPK